MKDLGNGPNKPTATTIGEYSASWHHGALIFILWHRRDFQILTKTKIWPDFKRYITDVCHDPIVYVACTVLSDLGNGTNKPAATIIGECSASSHDLVHWYSLWSGLESFQILTKI